MKITATKQNLQEATSRAGKITSRNTPLPILRCVLLIASGNTLKIRATNLDIGVEITVPAKVLKEGNVAVPGDILSNFLSATYVGETVTLEEVDGNLSITASSNTATIKSYPHEDFPILPSISKGKKITMHARDLIQGLKSVWYSASSASIKPELSSVYIYSDRDHIVFAATDSFRLAEKRMRAKTEGELDSILIPIKNIPEIVRNLESAEDDMVIAFNENQASFSVDGTYITSRVVDGVFPDYQQIVPKEHTTDVVVLKHDFINALKLSNVFSNQFNQVRMHIYPSKKTFVLETDNTDIGESTLKVAGALSGDDLDINFNHKYIVDCFQSIDADSVSLRFGGLGKPMLVKGVGEENFSYIVMPMNK